ncbi:hypothetical protein H0H87_007684 [Tephrocybe sp. NHM501043]|nr:hypothetical protein H0H87_007684 [Tephrocybe sp. NHM501043]
MGTNSSLFPETTFSFPPIYPDPPQPQTHTHRQPRAMSAGEPSDFSSRYRARADLLRRTGEQVGFSGSLSDIRGSSSVWSSGTGGRDASMWNQPRFTEDQRHLPHPHPFQLNEDAPGYRRYSMEPGMSRSRPEFDINDLDFSDSSNSIHSSSAGSEVDVAMRMREGFRSSDTYSLPQPGSSHSSTSLPQSFHSSSRFPSTRLSQPSTSSQTSNAVSTTIPPTLAAPAPSVADTFDESAFGALSLEDPALLAPDAPPFFSAIGTGSSEDPVLTPTPARPNTGAGAGGSVTEGDGELWRAFMRNTPGEQGHNQAQGQGMSVMERRDSVPAPSGHLQSYPYAPHHQRRSSPPQSQYPMSSQSRFDGTQSQYTPEHEQQRPDDLTRYQAAVLAHAREAQPILREPPPSRRGTIDVSQLLSARANGGSRSRPGSAGSTASASTTSSATSSLAGVFGGGATGGIREMRPRVKRGLSGAMPGMGDDGPESKRRGAVGGEGGS